MDDLDPNVSIGHFPARYVAYDRYLLTMDTCFWPEFFLLQYTNAVGMTFWSVVAPSNNRGDPPVIHPPHKPGWLRRPLPSYPSTRNFRYPLWMKRKLKVHPLVDRLKIRWAMKKHGMQ